MAYLHVGPEDIRPATTKQVESYRKTSSRVLVVERQRSNLQGFGLFIRLGNLRSKLL